MLGALAPIGTGAFSLMLDEARLADAVEVGDRGRCRVWPRSRRGVWRRRLLRWRRRGRRRRDPGKDDPRDDAQPHEPERVPLPGVWSPMVGGMGGAGGARCRLLPAAAAGFSPAASPARTGRAPPMPLEEQQGQRLELEVELGRARCIRRRAPAGEFLFVFFGGGGRGGEE